MRHILLRGIGDSYHRCNNPDSAIHYYNIALNKARLVGDSLTISSVLQALSRHYIHYHQDETALAYAQQALNYRGSYDLSLLKLFAQCYTETGDLDKAQQYMLRCLLQSLKRTQLVRLGMLHRLRAKTGDADAAQEYFDSAFDVAADMYLSTQKEKLDLQRRNCMRHWSGCGQNHD